MMSRSEFLAERRLGIGGSDAAAVLGVDRYRTPYDLWLEKTGLVEDDAPDVEWGHMRRGNALEPVIAEMAEAQLGRLTVPDALAAHPEHSFIIGHPDRLTELAEVVEIKAPSLAVYRRLQRQGLGLSWALQGQHYLLATGAPRGFFAVFCADLWEPPLVFPFEQDPNVARLLIERESEFWAYVQQRTPPPPPPPPPAELAEEGPDLPGGALPRPELAGLLLR
jgi:putative phage-type endonuclease